MKPVFFKTQKKIQRMVREKPQQKKRTPGWFLQSWQRQARHNLVRSC
jgi:hypothetical protein